MTDNSDGTYTYNYHVANPGTITVSVILYTQNGVYSEFFPDVDGQTGSNVHNSTWQTINLQEANHTLYPNRIENILGNFYFKVRSPVTGTLNFTISVDDSITMYRMTCIKWEKKRNFKDINSQSIDFVLLF